MNFRQGAYTQDSGNCQRQQCPAAQSGHWGHPRVMNAQQLKETTLDPKSRTLLSVSLDSLVEADQTFSQLLGKDASERYRIIMNEANLVDDLDL